jgi:hypothetical protein
MAMIDLYPPGVVECAGQPEEETAGIIQRHDTSKYPPKIAAIDVAGTATDSRTMTARARSGLQGRWTIARFCIGSAFSGSRPSHCPASSVGESMLLIYNP